jgi:condensin complex subunit 1
MTESTFPIPASLQDLEREPFNLQPYPTDFDDSDESARADSFQKLVDLLEDGNYTLTAEGSTLFGEGMENDPWNSYDRMQAMYTLVR